MSEKAAETIQTLLEAEESAKTVIDAARVARDARLKAAVDEADAEIGAYRARKDKEYKEKVASYAGLSGESAEEIARNASADVEAVRESAGQRVGEVVDMLVGAVTKVNVKAPEVGA